MSIHFFSLIVVYINRDANSYPVCYGLLPCLLWAVLSASVLESVNLFLN